MHLVLIRYKDCSSNVRDIAVLRNKPSAEKYVEGLKQKFPSYQCGEFEFARVKYIK